MTTLRQPEADHCVPVPDSWAPQDFESVMRQHGSAVHRRAYQLTRDREDAKDLAQDVFVRVLRGLSTYRPGNLQAWLNRITLNVYLDDVRRRRKHPVGHLEDHVMDGIASPSSSPDVVLERASFDDDVLAALKALPPHYMHAVVLCDVRDLTYAQIASTLGIKVGTVRSRIHRGRRLLRKSLAHRAPASLTAVTVVATPVV